MSVEAPKKCECQFCKDFVRVKDAISGRDPDVLIGLVNELFDRLCHVEEDNSYMTCVLNGSWPGSVEQLERALERARNKLVVEAGMERIADGQQDREHVA